MVASTAAFGEDGFEIEALADGAYTIQAMAREGESDRVPVELSQGRSRSVTLTIRSRVSVEGRVVTSDGRPVAGAVIRYGESPETFRETLAGIDGDFQFSVRPGTIAIAVLVPGLPIHLGTRQIRSEGDEPPLILTMADAEASLHLLLGPSPPWPLVSRDGVSFFPVPTLFLPRGAAPPRELDSRGGYRLVVEPGLYLVCPFPSMSGDCLRASLGPGSEVTVSTGAFYEDRSPSTGDSQSKEKTP